MVSLWKNVHAFFYGCFSGKTQFSTWSTSSRDGNLKSTCVGLEPNTQKLTQKGAILYCVVPIGTYPDTVI